MTGAPGTAARPQVALFATCLGDQFFAEAVADAVRLLRHLGVEVAFPREQTCCGQPSFNAGHSSQARRMALHTIRVFRDAPYVVLPSGSCTAMLRKFYAELLDPDGDLAGDAGGLAGDAGDLARRTYELAEFVVHVLGVDELGDGLAGRRVAYHHGCHALRELGLEEEPLRLLENAGAELVEWEADRECCGFGGLFSVKAPEVSAAMADRKIDTLPGAGAASPPSPGTGAATASRRPGPADRDGPTRTVDVLTSADGGCLLHLAGRLRHRGLELPVRPLASLLREATGAPPRPDGGEPMTGSGPVTGASP